MCILPQENRNNVQEISTQSKAVSQGSNIAKLSIIAAVIVIVLNFTQITIFQNSLSALKMVELSVFAIVLSGIVSASVGLLKGWSHRDSSIIILAATGLLLNGGMLANGFVKLPVKGSGSKSTVTTMVISENDSRPESIRRQRKSVKVVTIASSGSYVTELTDSTFDQAISKSIVLVDFWASWCGPCRRMSPVIDELAQHYQGRVNVCKLNVDRCRNTAAKSGVRGIPTIILYQNGKIIKKWIGVTDKSAIMLEINKLI